MISVDSILMSRAKFDELPADLKANVKRLHSALFDLETAHGKPFVVTSGYRPPEANKAAGGAAKSAHMTCEACDLSDPDGKLWAWCLQNLELLTGLGLYLEDKRWCKGWVHFQIRVPKSKNRIFMPKVGPAPWPEIWDGKY